MINSRYNISMKLGIFTNFSWPHIGGSETVLKNISELLVKNYNYEVNVYSCSCRGFLSKKDVNYSPCKRGNNIVSQMMENDHIFIYSDSFWEFDTLLRNVEKVDSGATVGLVGAYNSRSNPQIADLLIKNKNKLNFITHSDGEDYKWAVEKGLEPHIIRNGINIDEFENNAINFREKYNIRKEHILLNVSNFFYGKGQDYLSDIARELSKHINNFIIIQISNTIKYPYDLRFFNRCKSKCRGLNIRFLRDIPREDVVAAFKGSDAFVFTSRKEVAPLVILEAKAAKLPFVCLGVGKRETGGAIIGSKLYAYDNKGYIIVDRNIIKHFVYSCSYLIHRKNFREAVIKEGAADILERDWKNIVPLYNKVFNNE